MLAAGTKEVEGESVARGQPGPALAETRPVLSGKSCLQHKADLDAFLDGRLSLEPDSEFLHHLTACRGCCRALEAWVVVRNGLGGRLG